MATNKVLLDSKLVLRGEDGTSASGTPLIKNIFTTSSLREDADDAAVLEAAKAIASLQTAPLDSIRRIDTSELTEGA